eukprot:scaffold73619_cov75-Phaeocystis_antarctica.AAC.5
MRPLDGPLGRKSTKRDRARAEQWRQRELAQGDSETAPTLARCTREGVRCSGTLGFVWACGDQAPINSRCIPIAYEEQDR